MLFKGIWVRVKQVLSVHFVRKKREDTVSSPTFSIINEYAYPSGLIYHLDLYRLKNEDEALRAGVEDCLNSRSICLVEWPNRAPGIFPKEDTGNFP